MTIPGEDKREVPMSVEELKGLMREYERLNRVPRIENPDYYPGSYQLPTMHSEETAKGIVHVIDALDAAGFTIWIDEHGLVCLGLVEN